MAVFLGPNAKNGMLNALRDLMDAGAGPAVIRIYTGPKPVAGAAITSQVLLGTLTCSDPSAPNASGGTLTLSAITADSSADATGVAVWARILDSSSNLIMDIDVSNGAGAGEMKLSTVNIVAAGTITVSSAAISFN